MKTAAVDLAKQIEDPKAARAVDKLLTSLISKHASEARIFPEGGELQAELSSQGERISSVSLPGGMQSAIVARIKFLAGLDVGDHQHSQTGKITAQNEAGSVSFRVSTHPVFDGEQVLLRRVDRGDKLLTFQELGFLPQTLSTIKKTLTKPQGLMLVVGPPGSGKTTTLYSLLAKLNTRGVSVSTVEDPIELQLPGINQMQVSHESGMSLASGIRSAVKSDTDVIMVGEIDDGYTLEEALHAAATGRMLLSAYTALDAAATLSSLLELKVELYQLAHTLNAIIAQRLVKRLCPACKKKGRLKAAQLEELKQRFDLDSFLKTMKTEGVISSAITSFDELDFYKASGCKECGNSGYLGRVGVFEILEISEQLAELVLEKPSLEQIQEQAKRDGMIPLWQNALVKAHLGLTSIEEALQILEK